MTTNQEHPSSLERSLVLAACLVSLLYVCFLCLYFSSHDIMWIDEFFAWNLISDPSFSHMVSSWNHGADSGGILYYIVGWVLLRMTGPHVLVMRLFSAGSLWLASFLYGKLLSRSFSPLAALCGISLLWGSHELVTRVAEVRFYGFYLLMAVVAVYATLSVISKPLQPVKIFLVCFCSHAALLSSHPMGLIYSGAILASLLVGERSKQTLIAAAGIVAAWPVLLLFRSAIHNGSGNAPDLPMPNLLDLLGSYHLPANRGADLLLALGISFCVFLVFRNTPQRWIFTNDSRPNLLRVSFFIFLTPLAFFLVSHLIRPVFMVRYMYPYFLAIATLGTLIVWAMSRLSIFRGSFPLRLACLSLFAVLITVVHVKEVRSERLRPQIDTQPLTQIPGNLPIVSPDPEAFFQLAFYPPGSRLPIYFPTTLESDLRRHVSLGMMGTIQQRGYWAGHMEDLVRFTHEHDQFLYLDFPLMQSVRQALLGASDWHTETVGTIQIRSEPISIIRFERIRH